MSHYVVHISIKEVTEAVPPRSGYSDGGTPRKVVDLADIAIKDDSLPAVLAKAVRHLGLVG